MKLVVDVNVADIAACICYFGTYLVVALCEQIRLVGICKEIPARKHGLMALMVLIYGVTLIGTIITSVSSLQYEASGGQRAGIHCQLPFVFIAAGTLFVMSLLGFYVSSGDRVYTKSKKQLFDMLMQELQEASLSTIRNHHAILRHAILTGLSHILLGGTLTGIGMCAAYFAIVLSLGGDIIVTIGVLYALLSAIVIIVTCCLSHLFLFRVAALFPTRETLRFFCTALCVVFSMGCLWLVLCVAFVSHSPNNSSSTPISHITPGILLTSMIVLCLGYQICVADCRMRTNRLLRSKKNKPLDEVEPESDSVIVQLQMHVSKRLVKPAAVKRCRHVKVHPTFADNSGIANNVTETDVYASRATDQIFSSHTASYDDYDNQVANEV